MTLGRIPNAGDLQRKKEKKKTCWNESVPLDDRPETRRGTRGKKWSRGKRETDRQGGTHTVREIRLEHLFSWLQLSHLAAIVCRSAENSAPTVRIRGHKARASARLVLYQLATNTAIPDDKAERVCRG